MTKRKAATIAGGILAAVLLLYLIGYLIMRFYFTSERIERMVARPIEQGLGREVTVATAGVHVFPAPGLHLDDIAVANATGPGFSDEPMLTLARLSLRLDVLELLSGDVVMTRTTLTQPHLLIETAPTGASGLSGLGGAGRDGERAGLPFPITLEQVRITDGSITYRNRADSTYARLRDIGSRLRIQLESDPVTIRSTGKTTIGTIHTGKRPDTHGKALPPIELRYAGATDPGERRLLVDSVSVKMAEGVIDARGSLTMKEGRMAADLAFDGTLRPRTLNALLEQELFTAGSIRIDGRIDGPIGETGAAAPVTATVDVIELTLRHDALAQPAVFSGEARVMGDSARATMRFSSGATRVSARSTAAGLWPMPGARMLPRVRAAVESPRIDLDELPADGRSRRNGRSGGSDTLPLFALPPLPLIATGTITVQTLEYRGVTVRGIDGRFAVDTAGAEVVLNGAYGGGTLESRSVGTVTPSGAPRFRQSLRLRGAAVPALTRDAFSLAGARFPPHPPLSGTARITARLDTRGATVADIRRTLTGTVDATVLSGSINRGAAVDALAEVVEELTGEKALLTFDTLAAQLTFDTGAVVVDTLHTRTPAGLWSAQGRIGLDGALDMVVRNNLPAGLSRKMLRLFGSGEEALDDALEGIPIPGIGDIAGAAGIPLDSRGLVTLRFAVAGTVNDPNVRFLGFSAAGARRRDGRREEQMRRRGEEQADTLRERALEELRDLLPGFGGD